MNIVFLPSVSLASLALTLLAMLGVSVVILFIPNPITVWKRFHPVKQEEMPDRFWYKVLEVIRKDGAIILHLRENRFPGKELFCTLRQEDGCERIEYREHVLSKHSLDLCVSFLSHRRIDGETIWCMDFDTKESCNISHVLWRFNNP